MRRFFIFLFSLPLLWQTTSCESNEIGNSKDVNPQSIYFDYKIWGVENGDMTVMLQYRFAGPNGTTLTLETPSKVEFDGQPVKADSSKVTGAFYEIMKPVADFTGKHSIVFTGFDKQQYKEEFDFHPMLLKTELPGIIKREDFYVDIAGLDSIDYVRVSLTDTSFSSEGINRVDTVRNGHLHISREDLGTVVNGPIRLELYREMESPLKNGTEEGGRISINYGIRRQFNLTGDVKQ